MPPIGLKSRKIFSGGIVLRGRHSGAVWFEKVLRLASVQSVITLSEPATRFASDAGLTKVAFLPSRSDWETPRASAQPPQTWMGIFTLRICSNRSLKLGIPTP
jgi:hypothetical protein